MLRVASPNADGAAGRGCGACTGQVLASDGIGVTGLEGGAGGLTGIVLADGPDEESVNSPLPPIRDDVSKRGRGTAPGGLGGGRKPPGAEAGGLGMGGLPSAGASGLARPRPLTEEGGGGGLGCPRGGGGGGGCPLPDIFRTGRCTESRGSTRRRDSTAPQR